MKKEKKNKINNTLLENEQQKKVIIVDPKKLQEQEQLFSEADLISPANKKIDKAEIIQLNNNSFLNVDEYVDDNYYSGKAKHFYKESFYYPLADLIGVERKEMDRFVKRRIVALLKGKLLYGRFPNAIQRKISARNPYTGYCTRSYFNYQTLTKKGDLSLREFINDFENILESVLLNKGNLKTFIIEYSSKFKIPIQPDFFD
jgi:hypothetical protein